MPPRFESVFGPGTQGTVMQIELDDERLGGARIEETAWGYTLHGLGLSATMRTLKMLSLGLGVSAIFTCTGLWVFPGSTFDGDLLPLKLAISTFLFLLGCFFVQLSQIGGRAEVQVDHQRRELRAVERMDGQAGKLLAIWTFDEIGAIDVTAGRFLIEDRQGDLLADLRLGRPNGRAKIYLRVQAA